MLHRKRILASLLAVLLLIGACTAVAEESELVLPEVATPFELELAPDEGLGDLELELAPEIENGPDEALGLTEGVELPDLEAPTEADGKQDPDGETGDALLQSDASDYDFEIKDGVLVKYHGSGGDVTIPSSVTSIGEYAFYSCGSLISVTIPNSVTSIGDWAFCRCGSLISVTIPNSVTSIGDTAFYGCGLISVTIPNSVTSIGESAFAWCTSLTSATISNSATSIGDWAFYMCTRLTSVTISNNVTSIGDWAFQDCCQLTGVTIPNSVTSIGELAFTGCDGLTSVTIPSSVTSIGGGIFAGCNNLKEIRVSGDNRCYVSKDGILYTRDMKSLLQCPGAKTSVTIPKSVTCIGDYAFSGCSGLTSITIPDSVTRIGNNSFWSCPMTRVIIPNSVASIGNDAFSYCSRLTRITIPKSVTSIGDTAFFCCYELSVIIIPKSVTFIGRDAFSYCQNLTIYCDSGSDAETYAKAYDIPFKPIDAAPAEEPTVIAAEAEQELIFLGVGQRLTPGIRFSDGKKHDYTSYGWTVLSGSCVKSYLTGLQAVKLGKATVKCELSLNERDVELDTGKKPTCKVQVAYKLPVEELKVAIGDTVHIEPKIYAGSYNRSFFADAIEWSSSNKEIAEVGQGGSIGTVYGIAKGTATVTMKGVDKAACTIKVTVCDPPTSISLDPKGPLELCGPDGDIKGETSQLTVKFNKGEYWSNVIYKSSNPKVASVSKSGLVQAKKGGNATITATAGKVKAHIKVKVLNPPTDIEFVRNGKKATKATVIKGMTIRLPDVRLTPKDAGGKSSIVYRKDGKIISGNSFKLSGNCTITATTYNGKKAELTVVVEGNKALTTLSKWYDALYNSKSGAQAKLVGKVNALNKAKKAKLKEIGKDFKGAKRQWAADDRFNDGVDGINVGSTDMSGGVDRAFKLIFYDEFAKSGSKIENLSKCKDEKAMVKAIAQMIKGSKQKMTVKLDGATYAFTFEDIGSYKLGAKFMQGKVKVTPARGSNKSYTFGATITDFKQIQAFMEDLEALAKAKMTNAVKTAFTDGLSTMGVTECMDYMKDLYAQSKPVKALLVGALNGNATEGMGTVLAKLVMNGKSGYKQLLDMDAQWKALKKYVGDNKTLLENAVLSTLNAHNVFSLNDMDELRTLLKDAKTVKEITAMTNNFDPSALGKKIDKAWAKH